MAYRYNFDNIQNVREYIEMAQTRFMKRRDTKMCNENVCKGKEKYKKTENEIDGYDIE